VAVDRKKGNSYRFSVNAAASREKLAIFPVDRGIAKFACRRRSRRAVWMAGTVA
jgi:streptogramin lyase